MVTFTGFFVESWFVCPLFCFGFAWIHSTKEFDSLNLVCRFGKGRRKIHVGLHLYLLMRIPPGGKLLLDCSPLYQSTVQVCHLLGHTSKFVLIYSFREPSKYQLEC